MGALDGAPPGMADVAQRLPPTYRLVTELARSAMSVVYLADEPSLPRRVALKVLAPEVAEDPTFRARFTREVEIAAALDHPNVIPIHAAGESGGLLYLTMRYVEGSDLAEIARRGPMELDETVRVLRQVADALDAAHGAGLVHRDVKPGNVLIDPRTGHAYLCDFGIATHVAAAGALTHTGTFVGTIDYVAPEQVQGWPVDGRADVYALGAVIFRCLAGSAPFVGEPSAVLWSHVNAPRPSLHLHRPDLPEGLDAVLARAMAKDPDDRHATCRELVDEVASARPGPALPGPARRRRPTVALVAALLLLLLLVVVVVVIVITQLGPGPFAGAELDRLPVALRGDCTAADTGPAGAASTLRCRDGSGQEVIVGFYDEATGSDRAYDDAVAASGVARASGDCGAAAGAEHRYPGAGDAVGRVSCERASGAARLVWTDRDARIVARAERGDGNELELYRSWEGWVGLPAFPTVQEQELIKLLPERVCRRAPASSLDGRAGAVAAVDCEPLGTGARTVRYLHFTDADATRRSYGDIAVAAGAPEGSSCLGEPADVPGEGVYDLRSVDLGRLLCRPVEAGEAAVTWTSDMLHVLGHAVGPDPQKIIGWWDNYRGPRLLQVVESVNEQASPPFPTEQERALLGRVPEPSRVNCVRPSATQVQANVGDAAVVAVACAAVNGPPIVFYYQFADAATMAGVYGPPSQPQPDCTTRPADFTGDAAYARPDGTTGMLRCGVNTGNRNVLVWTDDARTIMVLAFGGEPVVMLQWWQQEAGPR